MFDSMPFLAASSTVQPVTRLKWLSAPEPWAVFLLVMAALVASWFFYRRESSDASPNVRALLALLRTAALVTGMAILFRPVLATERIEVREGYTAVLVDDSLSMSFKDKFADPSKLESLEAAVGKGVEDLARMEVAKRALLNKQLGLVKGLSRKNRVRLYSFSELLTPLGELDKNPGPEPLAEVEATVGKLAPEGRLTAVGDALSAVRREFQGRRLAGVVLLTDGRNTGGTVLPERAADALGRRGIPVHAIGVGNPEESKDIAISGLHASEAVLVGDYVPFDVTVSHRGFPGEVLKIKLTLDGQEVAGEHVVLREERQDVRLSFQPSRPGEFVCRIEAERKPGELLYENNVLTHRLRVIDEKLRVLYVDGYPRWEYRYLKNALIRDHTMAVHCLLLSADPEFHQEHSPGLEPLTRFPATREELFSYHVLIIGDVDVQDTHWISREQLDLVREFVETFGGGVLFLGGEQSNPGDIAGSPIEPLLPVIPERRGDREVPSSRAVTQGFTIRLTPEGVEDPLMRLVNDRDMNRGLWEGGGPDGRGLPGMFWYAKVSKVKPGARVLGTHPEGDPVFALHFYGAGRSFFSAVDSTWRWRAGVGDRYFYRFWGQVIRFLGMGKLLGRTQRYRLSTDKTEYFFGDPVMVNLSVMDREFQPSQEPEQVLYVQAPDGTVESVKLPLRPERAGTYEAALTAGRIGTYRLWVGDASPEGEKLASRTFEVRVPVLELTDPTMDKAALERVAAISGGSFRELADAAGVINAIPEIEESIPSDVSEREVWDTWWMLLFFVGLLTVEWVVRKIYHML